MVQRSSVGCSSSLYCIWAYLFYSILCCLPGESVQQKKVLPLDLYPIFRIVCSVPGGVFPIAACAVVLPLELSVLQHVVLPLDMSVPH
jgi:hypothetical protein